MIKKFNKYKINEAYDGDYKEDISMKLKIYKYDRNRIIYKFGMMDIINDFFKPITTFIDGNQLEEYQYPLSLLYESGNYGVIKKGDKYSHPALKGYFVLENGKWCILNKINTNTNALIEILVDFLDYSYMNSKPNINPHINRDELDPWGEEEWDDDNDDLLGNLAGNAFLNKINEIIHRKPGIKEWLNETYPNKFDLYKYTKDIKMNSDKGERAENYAAHFLEAKNAKILYRGGEGNLIDMRFGCDLIIEKNNKILTVQIKSYSIKDYPVEGYKKVDIIIGVDKSYNGITMLYKDKIYEF